MYHKLTTQSPLKKCNTKLTSYSGGNLKVVGCSNLRCRHKELLFYIVDTTQDPILGLSASQELDIIKIVLNITLESDQFSQAYCKSQVIRGFGLSQGALPHSNRSFSHPSYYTVSKPPCGHKRETKTDSQ